MPHDPQASLRRSSSEAERIDPLAPGDFVHLPGPTNGFKDRVRRKGVMVCTVYRSRWHGFARYAIEKRIQFADGAWIVERVEQGWVWRGRKAPYYEFGPTSIEIHDDVLVDNRQEPVDL